MANSFEPAFHPTITSRLSRIHDLLGVEIPINQTQGVNGHNKVYGEATSVCAEGSSSQPALLDTQWNNWNQWDNTPPWNKTPPWNNWNQWNNT